MKEFIAYCIGVKELPKDTFIRHLEMDMETIFSFPPTEEPDVMPTVVGGSIGPFKTEKEAISMIEKLDEVDNDHAFFLEEVIGHMNDKDNFVEKNGNIWDFKNIDEITFEQ